jgi:electron transfer flavoprotein alpha subunit
MDLKKVLVYAEITNSKVNGVYFELLSKAKDLFPDYNASFACVIAGSSIEEALEELKNSGVDKIYAIDDARLGIYNPDYYCAVLESAVADFDPDLFLIGATPLGEEIAPTIGQRLKTGVAAHCIDLIIKEDGSLAQMVPAFGGKVIGEIFTPKTRPQIASIKPGIFVTNKIEQKQSQVTAIDKKCLDILSRIKPKAIHRKESGKMPIEKAPVIVCGGYGTGSKENWEQLEKFAALLGAAVGCSRPVIDAGWLEDESSMIGTSGKSVRPKLYIGIGISGATHHICGMKDSGTIININNDEESEIFNVSDYMAVGNGSDIIKKVIELIDADSRRE